MSLNFPRRPWLWVLMIALPMALSSCISDEAARYYLKEKYPPKAPKEVEVLRTEPTKAYVVMADFQARGASVNDMRDKAAAIGADAVIVSTLGGFRATQDEWASDNTYSDAYSRITGTAILYKK